MDIEDTVADKVFPEWDAYVKTNFPSTNTYEIIGRIKSVYERAYDLLPKQKIKTLMLEIEDVYNYIGQNPKITKKKLSTYLRKVSKKYAHKPSLFDLRVCYFIKIKLGEFLRNPNVENLLVTKKSRSLR